MIESFRGTSTLQITTDLKIIQISGNLFVYRQTHKLRKKAQTGNIPPPVLIPNQTVQGFANNEQIARLRVGKPIGIWMGENDPNNYVIGTPALLDYMKEWGFRNPDGRNIQKLCIENVFDAIEADKSLIDQVVLYSMYDHTFRDARGDFLPWAIYFNYIDGHIDRRNYNIDRTLEILQKRSDITLLSKGVTSIPEYNGGGPTLEFKWHPSVEMINCVGKQAQTYKSKHVITSMDLHRAIFDVDALGLREGKAALHNSYYGPVFD